MPRPPRRIEPGLIYHILNRGNGRRRLFAKDGDYQAFLDILAEGLARLPVDLLAYCLMGNHWHLVLRPRTADALQRLMQWVTLTHVRRHHGHHGAASGGGGTGSGGHLYQGRYKHFPVEADDHFLTLCRYVEGNALRAGLVMRAEAWRWSSLHQRRHRRSARPSSPTLCDWPVDRPANWLRLVNDAVPQRQLDIVRQCVSRDRPLGSAAWVKRTARRLGIEQALRPRGRPPRPTDTLSPRQQRRRKAAENQGMGQKGT
jgi:putative transposase